MTSKQRMSILLHRWPAACRKQGWDKNDRAKRLQVISQAVGRWVKSMSELDNSGDIDKVYAHLGLLNDSLRRTIETLPAEKVWLPAGAGAVEKEATVGERRRLLWLIRDKAAALGGEQYIVRLAKDKFHLVAGLTTLDDLTTGQLHQFMMTLHARRRAKQNTLVNQSYTSEETFPDQVEFTEAPEPELVAGPF